MKHQREHAGVLRAKLDSRRGQMQRFLADSRNGPKRAENERKKIKLGRDDFGKESINLAGDLKKALFKGNRAKVEMELEKLKERIQTEKLETLQQVRKRKKSSSSSCHCCCSCGKKSRFSRDD